MLKHVKPCISSDLLKVLNDMGHSDEIVLADGNFPGDSICQRAGIISLRADGVSVTELLDAVLDLMPLDDFVEHPVLTMQPAEKDKDMKLPHLDEFKQIVAKYDDRGAATFGDIERMAFYDYVKEHAYCVVTTGETRVYGNIILKKGVVK